MSAVLVAQAALPPSVEAAGGAVEAASGAIAVGYEHLTVDIVQIHKNMVLNLVHQHAVLIF